MSEIFQCIDAATGYCPCVLAETMECVTCSQLQGKNFCDCEWNGLCILNEYYMNNKKIKENRKHYEGILVQKKKIEDKLYLLKIETEQNLVENLNRAGSYIILRGKGEENYFDVPMSVLNTEKSKYIYILYQIKGCKTKVLNNSNKYIIRGPYWNGVLGIENLKKIKNSNCLVISKGMGQASIIPVIKEMLRNNNKIILFSDKGDLSSNYVYDSIKEENIEKNKVSINEKKIRKTIKEKDIKLIFSAGSDLLHESVYKIFKDINKNIKFMTTNNYKICCGEGVCGSCTNRTTKGKRVKVCKSKVSQKNFIN